MDGKIWSVGTTTEKEDSTSSNSFASIPIGSQRALTNYFDFGLSQTARFFFNLGLMSGVQRATTMESIISNSVEEKPIHTSPYWIEPEEMTLEEAKSRIERYFSDHHGENIDYGDLMENLNIYLPLIVEACEELEREGKIAKVD